MIDRLLLEPSPEAWLDQLDTVRPCPEWLEAARTGTRSALGLDSGLRVAATGHQAEIWHAGILAKDLAVAALPAARVHYVADHDANDPGLLSVPVFENGHLSLHRWRVLPVRHGAATGAQPPAAPMASPSEASQSIHAALAATTDQPTLAMQVAHATASLAAPWTGPIPRRSITGLLATPIGEALLDRMRDDPVSMARAYNAALGGTDRIARPLEIDGSSTELPLWFDLGNGRSRVRADQLESAQSLRPNALTALALIQLGACDLYVSGTGGVVYALAMERWIEAWLGAGVRAALAPRVVASATLALDHAVAAATIRPETLARIRNDPPAAPAGGPSAAKVPLLHAISGAPRGSRARRSAFDKLHTWIDAQRSTHAEKLATLELDTADARRLQQEQRLAQSRDWPFPFLEAHDLDALRESIQASLENGMRR